MRKALISLLAACAAVVGLVPVLGVPAGAVEHPRLVIEGTKATTKSYGPIPGSFPGSPDVQVYPDDCAGATPGIQVFCDNIPLRIVPPAGLGEVDNYFLTVTVSWDDPEGLDDVDIYLFDNRQIETEAGDPSPYYKQLNRSATSANPEVIKQLGGSLLDLNLVVLNWAGPNLGYTVTASITVVKFDPPFESLAPNFSPSSPGGSDSSFATPFDYSATPPPGSSSFSPAAPLFPEIPITPDTSFDFGASDFEQSIAAPPQIQTGLRLQRRPPQPVPGLVTAFWFGLVPVALLAGGWFLLMRRRRDSMAFA